MNNISKLEHFAQLDQLYSCMLEAAMHLQWDNLTNLHKDSRQIVLEITKSTSSLLDTAERQEKARLIKSILDKHTKITAEVSEWQQDVAPLLSSWLPINKPG